MQPWIQTASGKAVDLLAPKPEQIDFNDIAFALSRIQRFTGHTRIPYNVADHCLRVAELLPLELRIHGILHDAEEAFMGDISSPMKWAIEAELNCRGDRTESPIKRIGIWLTHAIYQAAGIRRPSSSIEHAIKFADLQMLVTEKRDLLGEAPRPWGFDDVPTLGPVINPLDSEYARKRWLEMYGRYRNIWLANNPQ